MGTKLIIKGADFGRISAPVITVSDAGVMTLTAETGATIKYTLDGGTPSATNGTTYSSPVTLDSSCTIKAIALLDGLSSSVRVLEYTKHVVLTDMTLQQCGLFLIRDNENYGKNANGSDWRMSNANNVLIPNGKTLHLQGLQADGKILRIGYIYYSNNDRSNPVVVGDSTVESDYYPININGGDSVDIVNNKGADYYFAFSFSDQNTASYEEGTKILVADFSPLKYYID